MQLNGGQFFDWSGFRKALNDYKGNDLSEDSYDESNISQQTQAVNELVDKIARLIHDKFSASVDLQQLTAIVSNTITNLKELTESSGFTQISGSRNSAEYRIILFGVPDQSSHSQFQALVITVTITADIQEESSWWGLTKSTKKEFGAQVDAARLNVTKGFKSFINW